MKRRVAALALLALLLGACSPAPDETSERPPARAEGTSGEDPAEPIDGSKEPEKATARPDPQRTAGRLTRVHRTFRARLAEWQTDGSVRGGGGWRDLQLLGLEQQVIMRRLARHPKLAERTIPLLRGHLRAQARSNIKAAQGLMELTTPIKPPIPDYPITRAELPDRLKRYYDIAQERFGIPWYVLASVNFIESKFGRFQGPSSAGAEGPMQFMPATWEAYGKGDVRRPYNAIMGAARYLKASGAPERMRDALYAYNHSDAYVDAILAYAGEMKRSETNLYDYYFWQVFIRTTKGYVQLTGPEL